MPVSGGRGGGREGGKCRDDLARGGFLCLLFIPATGLEPDLPVADSTPRPNTLDDRALTKAMDLLMQQPFPSGRGKREGDTGGERGRGGGTRNFLSARTLVESE